MLLLRTLLKLGEQSGKMLIKVSSIKDRVCCKSNLAPKAIGSKALEQDLVLLVIGTEQIYFHVHSNIQRFISLIVILTIPFLP